MAGGEVRASGGAIRLTGSLLLAALAVGSAGLAAAGGARLPAEPVAAAINLASRPAVVTLDVQRAWLDGEAARERRLDLVRRLIDRQAAQVTWLQAQEGAVGVPAEELRPMADQVTHELIRAASLKDQTGLDEIQLELADVARASAQVRVSDLRGLIDEARRLGVDGAAMDPAAAAADRAESAIAGAAGPADLWSTLDALAGSFASVSKLKQDREDELAAIAEAEQRSRDYYNSLAGLRDRGYSALAQGRNEAAWAAFMGRGGFGDSMAALEAAAPALETLDRSALGLAVTNEQALADAVHRQFITRLPHKVILISLAAQELWAYEDGGLAVHTLITTGRPALPTDVGLMRVYRKNSPWLMRSLWPPSSPYWYPDLTVRYAMWFHPAGEAIHDSWWRSWYGPSSNLGGYGSHGCVGLPYGPIDALYAWTPVDTPVVVIPGYGSVGAQLSQRTYNDPLMAARFGI
ncbi:MAG: hypothetical protein NVS9B1_17260 [Candidatus Dormibacteraceae bacterium]